MNQPWLPSTTNSVCVCEWVEVELSYPLQVLVLNMWQRRRPPRGRSRSFPPCPELHSGQELLCVLPLGSSSILLELPCLGGGPRPGALARGWAHLGHLREGGGLPGALARAWARATSERSVISLTLVLT